jgi:hypothetical protein
MARNVKAILDAANYVRDHGSEPFAWGERDCCLWVCDWIKDRRGVDPAARLRGCYHDEAGAIACWSDFGGLQVLALTLAKEAGLQQTETPVAGDVGLVQTWMGPAMAICLGDRWAVKGPRAVVVHRWPVLSAWIV